MTWPRFLYNPAQTAIFGFPPWGDRDDYRGIYTKAKYGHLAGGKAEAPMGPRFPEGAGCKPKIQLLSGMRGFRPPSSPPMGSPWTLKPSELRPIVGLLG